MGATLTKKVEFYSVLLKTPVYAESEPIIPVLENHFLSLAIYRPKPAGQCVELRT